MKLRFGAMGDKGTVLFAGVRDDVAPCGHKHKKIKTIERWSLFFWSGLRGSNSLPPPWQGGALPDELKPQLTVPLSIAQQNTLVNTKGGEIFISPPFFKVCNDQAMSLGSAALIARLLTMTVACSSLTLLLISSLSSSYFMYCNV